MADNNISLDQITESIKASNSFKEHFEIIDARYDARYSFATSKEAITKAEELGMNGFQYHAANGTVSQVQHIGEEWKTAVRTKTMDWDSSQGVVINSIQGNIDKDNFRAIAARNDYRAGLNADPDKELDKQMAKADVLAYGRIEDEELSIAAAGLITASAKSYPSYKAALDNPLLHGKPGLIKDIDEKHLNNLIVKDNGDLDKNALNEELRKELIDVADKTETAEIKEWDDVLGDAKIDRNREQRLRQQRVNEAETENDVEDDDKDKLVADADSSLASKDSALGALKSRAVHDEQGSKEKSELLIREINNQFYIEGNRYHFKEGGRNLAFLDKGKRLVTATNDDRVAKAMIKMAGAKGWKDIKVSGHNDFKRQVWLSANLAGLGVKGYTPTEQDWADFEASSRNMPNVVEKDHDGLQREPGANAAVRGGTSIDTSQSAVKGSQPTNDKAAGEKESNTENPKRVLTGVLLSHGAANYQHNPKESVSYFVKYATDNGEKIIWSKDLERAVIESGAKTGEKISLEYVNSKPVTVVSDKRDNRGNVVASEKISTHRNKWNIEVQENKGKVVDAVATAFIKDKVKDPAKAAALSDAINKKLQERVNAGNVPTVNVYDKNIANQNLKHISEILGRNTPERNSEHVR